MQNEYDFSNAQRGKFFRKDAVLKLSISLDPDVRDYRDIEFIETAK